MDFSHLDATTWATIWATISLVIFLGVVIYFGVPRMITKMLDDRIAKVQVELSEATRLRTEAEALLADYERRRVGAEAEAVGILTAAQEEARRLTEDANASLADLVTRRTRAVEDKIAQAEAQAVAEVRARSADLAVEAARIILTRQVAEKGDALVTQAIEDVSRRMN